MTLHKKPGAKRAAVTHSQRRSNTQRPVRKSGSSKAADQDAMPKSPAEQALPRPFIGQAISLLAEVLKFERPADGVLSQYFKTHRELGHTDRGRLAELIYAVLRQLGSLREVVGRSAPPEGHEARYLVLAALNMGLEQRKPKGVIHHSDQGSQYTSLAFGERCRQMQVRPSTGTVGDAYDNAMAESFFASLEGELIERNTFQSKAQARMAVFTWIEGWYNPRRRHSGLGYLSPLNFERSNEALFDVVEEAHVRAETTSETV